MVKNLTKDELTVLTNIHDEKYTVGENDKGVMVYNMDVNGKNMQITYERYKELAARVKNPKLANAFIKAKNVFEKNEDFNRDEFKHIIKQDISNKEQSFVDGLYEDFMGQTFYKLLLDDKSIANEAMIAIANADPNDKITLEAIKNPGEIKRDIIAAITDPENPAFNLERSMDIMADKLTDMAEKSHKNKWDKIAQKEQAALNRQLETQGKTIYMPAVGNYVNRELVDDDVAIINSGKDFPIRTSYNNVQFRKVNGTHQIKDKNNKFVDVTLDELLATLQFDEKHGIQRPEVPVFNSGGVAPGLVVEEVAKKQAENLVE